MNVFEVSGVLGVIGSLIMLSIALLVYIRDSEYRKGLAITRQLLVQKVAEAKVLVEMHGITQDAKDNDKRAKWILSAIEDAISRKRHPLLVLRSIAMDVGVELAIAARFRAQRDKGL